MNTPSKSLPGRFIWHDLAAADTTAALEFYGAVFGWKGIAENANGGQFIRLQCDGQDVGSMYRLSQREHLSGVPSHWTPYIGVADIGDTIRKVRIAGGQVVVGPFEVEGVARIAVVADVLGCIMGLWEALPHE